LEHLEVNEVNIELFENIKQLLFMNLEEKTKLKEKIDLLTQENRKLKKENVNLIEKFNEHSVESINKIRDQIKSGLGFYFSNEQKEQVSQWKSIQIICEIFQIENNQLTVLKPKTNTILIHPMLCSFVHHQIDSEKQESCFRGCSSLTQISLPNSIISLDNYCFYGCSLLTQISLPNSISSLDWYCFRGYSSLTQISLPSSITSLSDGCFYGCSSLTRINRQSSLVIIGNNIFDGCISLSSQIKINFICSKITFKK
jgi:hypothetical protein